MLSTIELLEVTDFPSIYRDRTQTLQVNLGYRCNQTCVHCHVNAGPNRTEMMSDALIDLTEFLAEQQVEVVASLPCYSVENVDKQRGKGVFDLSIAGLQKLNALGYGQPGSGLVLNLVYNPQGPSLPPPQQALEADYTRELAEHFGIVFNQLFTITNMPIKRFGSMLLSKGQFEPYMQLLKDNFSQSNLDNLMCRSTLSVDWQGRLYDCDFNQQLEMPVPGTRRNLGDLLGHCRCLFYAGPAPMADTGRAQVGSGPV
jgi:radical SAM/Cys-rich protein